MNFAPCPGAALDPLPQKTGDELLTEMFLAGDWLAGEIFSRVYGAGSCRQFEQFQKTKTLPDAVRRFCHEAIAGKHSRLAP